MQQLIRQPIHLPKLLIDLPLSVFRVADQGMADGGKMRPDLVRLPGNQVNLQQRNPGIGCQNPEGRLNFSEPLCMRRMFRKYLNRIGLPIPGDPAGQFPCTHNASFSGRNSA